MPPHHVAGFLVVRDLSDEEYGAVVATFEKANPAEELPVTGLVRRITESVPRLATREARSLIRALLSVESARHVHGHSVGEFADGVASSGTLDLSPEVAAELARRVETLAQVPAIAITAKAIDIADENDRDYHSARIITDLRPVFGDDATQPPVGVVVIHLLRIDAFKNGQVEDYYVALDNADLSELHRVVSRAIDKNASLSQVLDNTGFSRFDPSEE